jgi:V/A-type H+-transporting ATPase subunit C
MLLKRQDYHRFMKMSVPEITKYLQDNDYGADINPLAAKYSGTELAELSLSRNTERRFEKLRSVCDPNLKLLVDAYLKRHDVHNIKTVLRAKNMKVSQTDALEMMIFAGTLGKEFYQDLLKEDNMQSLIKKIEAKGFLPSGNGKDHTHVNILQIENMLDREYYSSLCKLAKIIPVEGDIFRSYIKDEIEHMNILLLLRLKREGIPKDQIMKFLFFPNGLLSKSKFLPLIDLDFLQVLESVSRSHNIKSGVAEFHESESLIPIERELTRELLKKSRKVSHKNILSIDTILNYMFAKEVEIRNLRLLIKGKSLSLDENFIEKGMVV